MLMAVRWATKFECRLKLSPKGHLLRGYRFFRRGGSLKGGYPVGFEISSPRKRDFCHSEAKSACFNISFKIDCIYLIFLQVFDVSCFKLEPPNSP